MTARDVKDILGARVLVGEDHWRWKCGVPAVPI